MIKITNLNKYYNKGNKNENHVINNFSYEFSDKGLYVLFGHSGSGKTTLLNVIGGMDSFDSGEIIFKDIPIKKYVSKKADELRNEMIGFIFQNYNLIDSKNVYENVEFILDIIGIKDVNEKKKRIEEVLKAVGLYKHRKRSVLALSGGERQRVAIARALAKDPKVILADEPTGNLDSNNTFEIMNIIKRISKDRLVILVSHEEDLVNYYADRILEIKDGQMISDIKNDNSSSLLHKDTRNIYLKDYDKDSETLENITIRKYSNGNLKDITFDIIFKDNEIYIKADSKSKIHFIDNTSEIKLLDASENEFQKNIENFESSFSFDSFNSESKSNKTSFKSFFKSLFASSKQSFIKKRRFTNFALIIASVIFAFMITALSAIFDFNELDYTFAPENVVEVTIGYNDIANDLSARKVLDALKDDQNVISIIPDTYVSLSLDASRFYQTSTYANIFIPNIFLTKDSPNLKYKITVGENVKAENEILITELLAKKIISSNQAKYNSLKEFKELIGKKVTFNITTYDYYDDGPSYTIAGIVDNKSISVIFKETEYDRIIDNIKLEDDSYYSSYIPYHDLIYISTKNTKETKNILLDYGFSNVDISSEVARQKFILNRINNEMTRMITLLIMAIGILTYLIFMIRSSMFDRIKDIGIMRSIGAKKKNIISIFIKEMIMITTRSSFISFTTAYLIILYYNTHFSLESIGINIVSTSFITYIVGILLIYLVNIISAIIPTSMLLRRTPVEIIKKYDI